MNKKAIRELVAKAIKKFALNVIETRMKDGTIDAISVTSLADASWRQALEAIDALDRAEAAKDCRKAALAKAEKAISDLHAAGGDAWDSVPDPDAKIADVAPAAPSPPVCGWKDANEIPPPISRSVLAWHANAWPAYYSIGVVIGASIGGNNEYAITHWHELPKSPTENEAPEYMPTVDAPPAGDVCECGKVEHGRHHIACPAFRPKQKARE